MVSIYLLLGISASFIGALPLGASNIVVINTTIKQNAKQAFKIAITAGIAEVILSYFALHCNMFIRDFFQANMWLQVLIIVLLVSVGLLLFFKKHSQNTPRRKRFDQSKYINGFFLGLINPPVLFYWIIAFGIINNNDAMLSPKSSLLVLFLFFFGVYLGKLLTLYLYSRFSLVIKNKVQNITLTINKVTGVLLVMISLIQAVKLYLF